MKLAFFFMVLLLFTPIIASPALFGLAIITNKGSYVPNETVQIQNSVYYGINNPAYGADVNNTIVDPLGNVTQILSCKTDREGICTTNFTIQGILGEWKIVGFTELSGTSVNSTSYFNLHEEVCGDGICDINEPSYCEEDCGKANQEKCSANNDCYSEICCQGICRDRCPFCGDGYCDEGEECPEDCGEEIEDVISGGGGFFEIIGMKIYFDAYEEVFQNSFVEGEITVENLMNSTQENTTIIINGVAEYKLLPDSQTLQELSNHTFLLSIPILAGENPGNKTIEIIAVSNKSRSKKQTMTILVRGQEFDESADCSLEQCDDLCCENYVCCEGVCRTQCPVCGDNICSSTENCLSCEPDCGKCGGPVVIGNKTLAIEMMKKAEKALQESNLVVFQKMLDGSYYSLNLSQNMFRVLDYESSYRHAMSSLQNTQRAQAYEYAVYGSFAVSMALFSVFAFNKFYKSRKAKKKHGKGGNKKRGKN